MTSPKKSQIEMLRESLEERGRRVEEILAASKAAVQLSNRLAEDVAALKAKMEICINQIRDLTENLTKGNGVQTRIEANRQRLEALEERLAGCQGRAKARLVVVWSIGGTILAGIAVWLLKGTIEHLFK